MTAILNSFTTHQVFNQSAPLEDYNLFGSNVALGDALAFNLPKERLEEARDRLGGDRRRTGQA